MNHDLRRRLLGLLATTLVLGGRAGAQWTPPAPYDQLIRVVQDCSATGGDIAIARNDGRQPVIVYCQAAADLINARHPGAGHFAFVHEYGHHILGSSDERAVDCWAAMQLANAPDGQKYLDAAIAHFTSRANEPVNPRYGSMLERAERLRQCSRQQVSKAKSASVALVMWERTPGPTGFEADAFVDGKPVGRIGNLGDPQRLRLGDLSMGPHRYELRNGSGFLIDASGSATATLASGLTCSNTFNVLGRQTFHLAAWLDRGGFVCRFEPGPVETPDEESALSEASAREEDAPERKPQLFDVELYVWEPTPGPTAITATLYVDGSQATEIDNRYGEQELDLGKLSAGKHKYQLRNLDGYSLDYFGNATRFLAGAQCSGEFVVSDDGTYALAARYANGILTCAITRQ